MQKIIYKYFTFLLLAACSPKSFEDVKNEVVDLNKKAASCMKSLSLEDSKLCTFEYDLNSKVYESKNDCEKSFDIKGIATIYVDDENKNDFPDFYNSTNRALLDHINRKVLFKKKIYNLVDCYHEYIHLLQAHYGNELGLNRRRKLSERFKVLLAKQADKVAYHEKKQEEKQALKLANQVQNGINELQKFNSLAKNLDEIEAYHLVLRRCNDLKCSRNDREIALANLLKNKAHLNAEYVKWLEKSAKEVILSKKKELFQSVNKKWKKSNLKKVIKELIQLSPYKLIQKIKQSRIGLYRIASSSNFNMKLFEKDMLSKDIYNKIPVVEDELRDLIGVKILLGKAMGKFVCSEDKKFIIGNRLLSKATLIHEYLHFIQSKTNPSYCGGDIKQKQLYSQFSQGRIDKKTYEKEVLKIQIQDQLAEYEVYSELVKYENEFSDIVNLNNKAKLQELQHDLQYLR
jgi:hypothetical protein